MILVSGHWQLDRIFGVLMQKTSLTVAGPLRSPTNLDIQNPAVNLQEFKWGKIEQLIKFSLQIDFLGCKVEVYV